MTELDLFENSTNKKRCIICGSFDVVDSIYMSSKNKYIDLCEEHFLVYKRLSDRHG